MSDPTAHLPRLGVVWRPDTDPRSLAALAKASEQAGADELWLWEDCFLQGGIAQAAVALSATESLVVGVGVLPAPLRSVVATALELSTLAAIFPGRVQVAIGHGVQDWMRQAGVAVKSPMSLLREYVTVLRGLLAGESVSVAGDYIRLDAVRLEFVPEVKVPVLAGGAGPKTLTLAGEVADGVLLDCQQTIAGVRSSLKHVEQGRQPRDVRPFRRVMYLACFPGADPAAQLAAEAQRWNVTPAKEFGVGGTVSNISRGIEPYCEAGLDTIILQPIGAQPDLRALLPTLTGLVETRRAPGPSNG